MGEARWTSRPLGSQVLQALRAKAPAVLPDPDWHVHYALFSRSGFTEQLAAQADGEGVWLVGLSDIVQDE